MTVQGRPKRRQTAGKRKSAKKKAHRKKKVNEKKKVDRKKKVNEKKKVDRKKKVNRKSEEDDREGKQVISHKTDKEEMSKAPDHIEFMKMIGEHMRLHMKQEQEEKAKNYRFLNQSALKGQILFTGSSLMEQFPIAELARSRGIDSVIYNRGIGGYTTDDFLAEIDTVLFDLAPSKIFINIGTNDISEREDGSDWQVHLLTNYKTILQKIKEGLPQAQVYMMAYYPVNPVVADNEIAAHMLKTRTNANLRIINEKLKALAESCGCFYIDANDGLCDEAGNLKAEYTKEWIHLYCNAYEIVFRNLIRYL